MSDLEFFGGADSGGEADPAAFERFKERMKRAAAQLKAIQKSEQKQKKNEDELVKILMKFLKSGKKRDILQLVIRLLEQNVPAGFIVSLLLISNQEIQDELKVKLLPANLTPEQESAVSEGSSKNLPDRYMGDQILPLKVKMAIANWINEITRRVSDTPQRILKTTVDPDGLVMLTPIQLGAFCMRDFLDENGVETDYSPIKDFVEFFLNDIMQKAHKELKERKEISGEVD